MRTKQDSTYIKDRISRMIKIYPDSSLTENRIKAIKAVLQNRYPSIQTLQDDILKDIIFVDRQMRRATENSQTQLKKQLSDKFIKEEL